MGINVTSKKSFDKTIKFLNKSQNNKARILQILEKYGRIGVDRLYQATPKQSGKTALSWEYLVSVDNNGYMVGWQNTNYEDGLPVAILIQYGHSTGTGGYVSGVDYINPAIKPIIDEISKAVWEEVSHS